MKIQVVTPEGSVLDSEADLVEIPTSEGELGVLPGHAPLVGEVGAGELRVYKGRTSDAFAVVGGFLEVEPGIVRVMATFATHGDDEAEIESAVERAKAALDNAGTASPEAVSRDLALLRSELGRLRIRRTRTSI